MKNFLFTEYNKQNRRLTTLETCYKFSIPTDIDTILSNAVIKNERHIKKHHENWVKTLPNLNSLRRFCTEFDFGYENHFLMKNDNNEIYFLEIPNYHYLPFKSIFDSWQFFEDCYGYDYTFLTSDIIDLITKINQAKRIQKVVRKWFGMPYRNKIQYHAPGHSCRYFFEHITTCQY